MSENTKNLVRPGDAGAQYWTDAVEKVWRKIAGQMLEQAERLAVDPQHPVKMGVGFVHVERVLSARQETIAGSETLMTAMIPVPVYQGVATWTVKWGQELKVKTQEQYQMGGIFVGCEFPVMLHPDEMKAGYELADTLVGSMCLAVAQSAAKMRRVGGAAPGGF